MLRFNSSTTPSSVASGSGSGTKRKSCDDSYSLLEENIKRFRITSSPGEIRLSHDLKDTKDIIGVWCEMSEYPACVMITFDEVSGTAPTPRRFMVKVSKYYPHDRPLVVCMDAGYQNVSLGAGGEVRHTYLQEGWTAMGSLRSIITLLAAMRASDMFAKPPERVAEGPTMSPSWRKYGSHGNGNGNGSGVTDTEMQFSSPVSAVASSCAMEDL